MKNKRATSSFKPKSHRLINQTYTTNTPKTLLIVTSISKKKTENKKVVTTSKRLNPRTPKILPITQTPDTPNLSIRLKRSDCLSNSRPPKRPPKIKKNIPTLKHPLTLRIPAPLNKLTPPTSSKKTRPRRHRLIRGNHLNSRARKEIKRARSRASSRASSRTSSLATTKKETKMNKKKTATA